MKTPPSRLVKNVTLLAGFVLLGVVGLSVSASAGVTASSDGPSRAQLKQELGPGARIAYHSETGKARFIGSAPDKPLSRPSGLAASAPATVVARAFLDRFGKAFGIDDQAQELRVTSVRAASAGRSVVRFQQVHDGVRVLGGELVTNLDGSKNLLSIGGEVVPSPDVSVLPRITSPSARDTALRTVAKARDLSVSKLRASEPSLWIYDSRILGGPGLGRPTLVWRMDVTGETGSQPIDELVLVDAQLGAVALHFDQLEKAKYRQVCDANNSDSKLPCTAPFDRVEGGAASAIADVNNAYDYAGATYDFYLNYLGRDSIDGAGMTIKSTTRYCDPYSYCPLENAYWDGTQMVYGEGFASADDVVGHELTHGVTQYTSHLFYYYQSGAIDESLSDIFGEFVDQTDGLGNDSPSVRWQLGEDLPPSIGVVRDMKDPPLYGQPDKMTSSNYTADLDELDNGGVHTNSGVGNKAAFLITDGGTFNAITVTGIGIAKAARIYYEVETNKLTSASDYSDLYSALSSACLDLRGTAGISDADCTEVVKALNAVEMNVIPPTAPNPEAPAVCPGETAHYLFFDDLENTTAGNWVKQTGSGANTWYYPQNSNPFDFDATYATSGTTNLWGYDQGGSGDGDTPNSDYSIAMTVNATLPVGSTPYLRFRHAHMFESAVGAWDGGVLEYSTNNGASWSDAGPLLTDNGYNGTISTSYGNPLGGRSAFVKDSNGYISSRAGLASLAGQNVRFRFRIGTDSSNWDYGWFLDDIGVYTCSTVPHAVPVGSAGGPYTISEGQPLQLNGSGSDPDGDPVTFFWDLSEPYTTDRSHDASGPNPTISWNTLKALGHGDGPATFVSALWIADFGPYPKTTLGESAFVDIVNVPPQAGIVGPSTSTAGVSATWTFSATDPSPTDQAGTFTYKIDWNGDGTLDQIINGSHSLNVAHTFPNAGPVAIKVTATDKDGGQSTLVGKSVTVNHTGTLSLSSANYSVAEAGPSAAITVTRSANMTGTPSVHFATADGTARAGLDYTAVSQTVTFVSGESSKTVFVPIINDKLLEGNETVRLTLSSPSANALLGSPTTATLTIVNSPGKITSAKLTKKSFKRSQARKVKLAVTFSPASKRFNYLLTFKKGARWVTVRSVKKSGNFGGKRSMTVKSLFGAKAIKRGSYRLKLTADANSKTLSFKVT